MTIDPITLGVVWGALQSIAVEIGTTVHRTAYSEQAREGQDFSVAVFDAQGRMVAQGPTRPVTWGPCRRPCATRWPPIRSRRCGPATRSC
jgi:N-methylhydantoinase B/oxoprolinase/acetone carboxylase alpha subunit